MWALLSSSNPLFCNSMLLRLPTCAATGGRVVTTRTRGGRVACGVVACAPSARRRAAPTGDWGPLRAPPNSLHRWVACRLSTPYAAKSYDLVYTHARVAPEV